MNKKKTFLILTFCSILTMLACTNSAEEIETTSTSTEISAANFSKNLDENPVNNFEVGVISATSQTSLNYTFVSQSPSNSMAINQTTGMITVLDKTKFDFEANPTITGVVKISNSSKSTNVNVSILLNDVAELTHKWFLDKLIYNSNLQTLTTCDKQGYIQFNTNGTFERKDYYWNGTSCLIEGNDIGTYTFNSTTNKITLNFVDPNNGSQTEILNNVIFTNTTLKYTWDEDGNGTDEHNLEFKK